MTRTASLLLSLSLLACSGDKEQNEDTNAESDTDADSDADTDADADADADSDADSDADADADSPLSLTGDDTLVDEVWWSSVVYNLVEGGGLLTGTVAYREEDPSGATICTATLEVEAVSAPDTACFGVDCVWGYLYTLSPVGEDGSCAYTNTYTAINLANEANLGFWAYFEDAVVDEAAYDQLLYTGVIEGSGDWGRSTVASSSADGAYGLEQYNLETGVISADLGAFGDTRNLFYTGDCATVSDSGDAPAWNETPLEGQIEASDRFDQTVGDVWSVDLTAGQRLRVSMLPDDPNDYVKVSLVSPEGCRAGDAWGLACGDGDGETCWTIEHDAETTGTYQVILAAGGCFDDGTCGYALHAEIE